MQQNTMKPEGCLIFVHIPKTAGTSFNAALVAQYAPDNYKVGVWDQRTRSIAEFFALPESERRQLTCVHGHMPYGLHTAIPGEHTYISIFRDPVERVLSWYRRKIRKGQIPAGTSLTEFVQSDDFDVENGMVKRLAGRHAGPNRGLPLNVVSDMAGKPCPGECTAEEFAAASARVLADDFLVGIQERFDETLLFLHHVLKWPAPLGNGVHNCDPNPRRDWNESDLELIRKRNAHDIALYELVKQKFDDQIRSMGLAFQTELLALPRINSVLQDERLQQLEGGTLDGLLELIELEFQSGSTGPGAAILKLLASRFPDVFEGLYQQYQKVSSS
jgi:hypothetical protein